MRLVFEDQGWEDYVSWLKNDRKLLPRINKLLDDIRRDPCTGIGKQEPLKYHLPGAWSRRIDEEHRLVYLVADKAIVVLSSRYRYRPGTDDPGAGVARLFRRRAGWPFSGV